MERIPDVLDVWFDSGSVVWAAQKFYDGHEHYDSWEKLDFILEGKDQIRGWFNSLLGCATFSCGLSRSSSINNFIVYLYNIIVDLIFLSTIAYPLKQQT